MEHAKVFIVEDSLIFRIGLKGLISAEERFMFVGEADNGLEALLRIPEDKPDIILLDLELPRMDGVRFLQELSGLRLDLRILVISQDSLGHRIQELLELGIHGHILKADDSTEILRGMHAVANGERYFSSRMGERYFDLLREQRAAPPHTNSHTFTARKTSGPADRRR